MIKIKVREVRKERGLSLRQLEILSGISKATICAIENNKESPTLDTLDNLARGLKISIHDLIEEFR